MTIHNPWETTPSKSGLVNIGTRRLFARVMGRIRHAADPIIIIECGGGSSCELWLGVMRALSPNHRFLAYNRAGLGGSDPCPTPRPRLAVDIADDFERLLGAMRIAPPYVMLGHSYGGLQMRTWMEVHARMEDVAGAVFVDTVSEDLYAQMPLRSADYEFLYTLDVGKILGYDEHHKFFSDREYEKLKRQDPGRERLAVDESAAHLKTYRQYERRILRNKPVSVIRGHLEEDLRRLCVAAQQQNIGSPEQRRQIMNNLDRMEEVFEKTERQQTQLSGHSRVAYAKREAGHAVILWDPECVMKEIEWVSKQCVKRQV